MVIENYFDLGFTYSDVLLHYGEQIALSLSGAGIFSLLKN